MDIAWVLAPAHVVEAEDNSVFGRHTVRQVG